MPNGKSEMLCVIKQVENLVNDNTLNIPDEDMSIIAKAVKSIISIKVQQELSREMASRYLGISTRTFYRLVCSGEIPQGHRHGHKELSWYIDDLNKYLVSKRQ